MYMYPVITSNTTTENNINPMNNTNTNMPRNRSLSATSSPPPALLARGFASLRRAHRRLSNSSPSSPITGQSGENINITGNNSTPTSSAAPGLGVITDEELSNNNDGNITPSASTNLPTVSDANIVRPRVRLVPNVGLSSRSFVFDIIDRELEPGVIYRIGRFSDRSALAERISFKSKVTSRNHAELWTENGKVYLRDIGSSSGTFLNRIRLSSPSHVSTPHEIKDGDAIQLGVDYQGGLEPIYRAVRIRVEINRQTQNPNNPFARTAFQQLRSHLIGCAVNNDTTTTTAGSPPQSSDSPLPDLGLTREATKVYEPSGDLASSAADLTVRPPLSDMMSRHNITDMTRADIQECCICLYAIAPFQALFIAPCSHIFHFKCLRPIVFQNYPGFSCPLCRSYFDLEASVAIEVDEILEAISVAKEQPRQQQEQQQQPHVAPINTVPELNEEEEEEEAVEVHNRLDVTAESSIQPGSSNISEHSENDEVVEGLEINEQVKGRLGSTPPTALITTSPLPYLGVSDEHIESSSHPTSSPARAIDVNNSSNNQQSQLRTRSTRNSEVLLATTLVGSPIFRESVLPAAQQNNSDNIVS